MKIPTKKESRRNKDRANRFQTKMMRMIKGTVIFEITYGIINAYRLCGKYIRNEHWGFISHRKRLRSKRLLLALQSAAPLHSIRIQASTDKLT